MLWPPGLLPSHPQLLLLPARPLRLRSPPERLTHLVIHWLPISCGHSRRRLLVLHLQRHCPRPHLWVRLAISEAWGALQWLAALVSRKLQEEMEGYGRRLQSLDFRPAQPPEHSTQAMPWL